MKLGMVSNPEFVQALNDLNSMKLQPSLAYKVARITNRVAEEQQTFEKLKKDLISKYVVKDESGKPKIEVINEGGQSRVTAEFGENAETFSKEMFELETTDVDIQPIGTMDELVEKLEKSNVEISAAQINALRLIFKNPEDTVQ